MCHLIPPFRADATTLSMYCAIAHAPTFILMRLHPSICTFRFPNSGNKIVLFLVFLVFLQMQMHSCSATPPVERVQTPSVRPVMRLVRAPSAPLDACFTCKSCPVRRPSGCSFGCEQLGLCPKARPAIVRVLRTSQLLDNANQNNPNAARHNRSMG